MSKQQIVEDLELTAAEVEQIIADHFRRERQLPEDTEVTSFGILNRVYVTITTEEVIPTDARN